MDHWNGDAAEMMCVHVLKSKQQLTGKTQCCIGLSPHLKIVTGIYVPRLHDDKAVHLLLLHMGVTVGSIAAVAHDRRCNIHA